MPLDSKNISNSAKKSNNFFYLIFFTFCLVLFFVNLEKVCNSFLDKMFDTYDSVLEISKKSKNKPKKITFYSNLKRNIIKPLGAIITFSALVITILIVSKKIISKWEAIKKEKTPEGMVDKEKKEYMFFCAEDHYTGKFFHREENTLIDIVSIAFDIARAFVRKKENSQLLASQKIVPSFVIRVLGENEMYDLVKNTLRNLFPSGYFNDPYLVNVPLTANKSIIKTRKIEQLNNNINLCFALADIILYTAQQIREQDPKSEEFFLMDKKNDYSYTEQIKENINGHLREEICHFRNTAQTYAGNILLENGGFACKHCENESKLQKRSFKNDCLPVYEKFYGGLAHSFFYHFEEEDNNEVSAIPLCFRIAYVLKKGYYTQFDRDILRVERAKEVIEEYFKKVKEQDDQSAPKKIEISTTTTAKPIINNTDATTSQPIINNTEINTNTTTNTAKPINNTDINTNTNEIENKGDEKK